MPKKRDDATSSEKVLTLYILLMTSGRKHFQADLVERFQCSPQTVTRLAVAIESIIGNKIEFGKDGRRNWFRIRSISPRTLGLDYEELHYLSVCRELGSDLLPEHVRKRIDNTIMNLSVQMADHSRASDSNAAPKFSFYAKGRIDFTPHYETINTLMRAAEERRICTVHYKANSRNETKEHRFAPGRIVSMSNALYALGAGVTEDFSEIRHLTNLAVHRIVAVSPTEHIFDFDLPDCSANSFGLPWHEPRTFRIRFSSNCADYIRERIWADEQQMVDTEDGGVILEITSRSEKELMAWVRGFGVDVIDYHQVTELMTEEGK